MVAAVVGPGVLRRQHQCRHAHRRGDGQYRVGHPARRQGRIRRHLARSAASLCPADGSDHRGAVHDARRDLSTPQDRGRLAGPRPRLDQPAHHHVHHLLCADHPGDLALCAAHDPGPARTTGAVRGGGAVGARHRQPAAGNPPWPRLGGVSQFLPRDVSADGLVRARNVPSHGLLVARCHPFPNRI